MADKERRKKELQPNVSNAERGREKKKLVLAHILAEYRFFSLNS